MKRRLSLVTLVLILAACSADVAEQPVTGDASPPEQAPAAEAEAQPSATDLAPPASSMAPEIAADPTNGPQDIPATAAVMTEPDPTAPPEKATEIAPEETAVVINGRSEDGSYFLGRADAPVTIIDYSDFL
jgi:hypothetical protein